MSSVELTREDSTFKFPFTDSEDADLQLSKNYDNFRGGMRTRSQSSELGLGLSPIARDRDSMGYWDGDSLSLGSGDSMEKEPNVPQDQDINDKEIPIPQTENLEITMKQVGQNSNTFMDKMRDAANKRMEAVTKSRDSLVEKEKEQLRSIAECESRFESLKQKLQSGVDFDKENEPVFRKNKKNKGFGGVGVQLVEKRPTTKPVSPKMGLRRNGVKAKASEKSKGLSDGASAFQPIVKSTKIMIYNDAESPKTKSSKPRSPKKRNTTTKKSLTKEKVSAKPKPTPIQENKEFCEEYDLLSSKTQRWNAGQLGIPKVEKRATTVPVSPCIGPKRRSRRLAEKAEKLNHEQLQPKARVEISKPKEQIPKAKPKKSTSQRSSESSGSSRSIPAMSPASVKGSPLLGLDFIHSSRKEKKATTESTPVPQTTTRTLELPTFQPPALQSTTRADRREEYDMYRVEKHALTVQEKREQLQREIKALRRELKVLSKEI